MDTKLIYFDPLEIRGLFRLRLSNNFKQGALGSAVLVQCNELPMLLRNMYNAILLI